jgi:hypothetical protein
MTRSRQELSDYRWEERQRRSAASVPFEMFGAQTKNTHWDTDAVFVQ